MGANRFVSSNFCIIKTGLGQDDMLQQILFKTIFSTLLRKMFLGEKGGTYCELHRKCLIVRNVVKPSGLPWIGHDNCETIRNHC